MCYPIGCLLTYIIKEDGRGTSGAGVSARCHQSDAERPKIRVELTTPAPDAPAGCATHCRASHRESPWSFDGQVRYWTLKLGFASD